MDVVIPANFITPKIVFTGVKDPETYLTTFNAQMIFSRRTNVMHCKMFMGTDPAGNSNVEESLRGTLCPVFATASPGESPSELSLRCLQM